MPPILHADWATRVVAGIDAVHQRLTLEQLEPAWQEGSRLSLGLAVALGLDHSP